MEIKNKCKCCGATALQRIESGNYRCKYCGSIFEDKPVKEEPKQQKETEQKSERIEIKIETNSEPKVEKTTITKDKNANSGYYLILIIVCFVGGYFGAHKFVEGKILAGIIYLCTAGLFGVGWILDLIFYFSKFIAAVKSEGNL